jgi:hypothetical protein
LSPFPMDPKKDPKILFVGDPSPMKRVITALAALALRMPEHLMDPREAPPVPKVETWEPTREEYERAKELSTPVHNPGDKPLWSEPVLFLHASEVAPHEVEEAMAGAAYALSQQHQDDLGRFEALLTQELAAKGVPFVFIQPGAPGHKEAKRVAKDHARRAFENDAPFHPDHPRDF